MADVGRHPCYGLFSLALLGLAALLPGSLPAADEIAAPPPAAHSIDVTAKFGQQRVREILAERLPNLNPEGIDRIAQGFDEHLRRSSRLFSENFIAGRMDDGELISRVSVYLHDNPGLVGRVSPAVDSVGTRVRATLAARETSPHTPTERSALAERFVRDLAERSRLAHQNLLAGRMSNEELASRVSVFLEDFHAQSAASTGPDPAQLAAAEMIADQFVRKNFGSPNERATSLVYDCTVTSTDTGKAQALRFMRKSPNKVRIHFVQDTLVTLAMAYDGTTSWMQRPAKPVERLSDSQASTLVETAAFDHPLIGYRERGAQLTLRGGTAEPFELTLVETDGRSVSSTIDPITYQENRQLLVAADGRESEMRLSDYRRIGSTNVPLTQELWRGGARLITSRLENISSEVTLLDALFTAPGPEMVGYMDYMGGLALLQQRAAPVPPATAAAPAPPTASTLP